MRPFILLLLLSTPALAQCYTDIDLMFEQLRIQHYNPSDPDFSPRVTVGYQNEDLGARLRYWHLDTTNEIDYGLRVRGQFDTFDADVYRQFGGIRLFGGLRTGYVSMGYIFRDGSGIGIGSPIFGPTAGLESEVPIIGNLSADFGLRGSLLMTNWSGGLIGDSNIVENAATDTPFVAELYTGLDYRWNFADIGLKFEIQRWDSQMLDHQANFAPTIVGVGATASVAW